MNLRLASAIVASVALSACGTAGKNFSAALEKPAGAAEKAKAIAQQAERDFLKARYLGMASDAAPAAILENLVCVPGRGPGNATDGLAVFPAVLETVAEVGEKPADTSFAAYSKAFRNNAANIATASEDPEIRAAREQQELAVERLKRQQRCTALFAADRTAGMSLKTPPQKAGGAGALAALSGGIKLLKELMGVAERAQREQAVRTTITASIPTLDKAVAALAAPADANYGPKVEYAESAPQFGENGTVLGATINIRRWMMAKQIDAITRTLAGCGASDHSRRACLADGNKRREADEVVELSTQYRSLAAVDTAEVLTRLRKGVDAARNANKLSFADLIEGLVELSDTFDGLSKSYADFKSTRD